MSEAVKEILELKEDCDYKRISVDEILVLREYIEELEEYIDDDIEIRKGLIDRINRQQERIDKAIEYIKQESWFCYKDNEEVIGTTPINKLLEILGDKNE